MIELLRTFWMTYIPKGEKGQDLAEYGLLVGVIALVVIIGAILFGTNLLNFFNNLAAVVANW